MRYFFAAGILATAEFAAPYPIQCCARLSGAPNLIMRVFSRKHDCTRWDAANWQPSCAIAGFLRTNSGCQLNICLQARKHICKRARQSQTRCYPEASKDVEIWNRKRPRVEARKHDCVKARKHETVLNRLSAVGGVVCVLTSEHVSVLSCSRVRELACYKALGAGGAG